MDDSRQTRPTHPTLASLCLAIVVSKPSLAQALERLMDLMGFLSYPYLKNCASVPTPCLVKHFSLYILTSIFLLDVYLRTGCN